MKMKHMFVLFAALSLSACAVTYTAEEYPLSEERISEFNVRGNVTVRGAYDEPHPVKVTNMNADLKQISDQMASQMSDEIQRRHDGASGSDKEITVRVTRMAMVNRFVYNEGQINVELTLGNGETVSYERRNGSAGVVDRVLNGTIAVAIIEGLEHDTVRAYLAE
jgi:flagellar hook assembly protein FlgD